MTTTSDIVLNSSSNSDVLIKIQPLHSPYIGYNANERTFTLNDSLEKLCVNGEFIKLISMPGIFAKIELNLISEIKTITKSFEQDLELEIATLD